jgi:hypothetical protein
MSDRSTPLTGATDANPSPRVDHGRWIWLDRSDYNAALAKGEVIASFPVRPPLAEIYSGSRSIKSSVVTLEEALPIQVDESVVDYETSNNGICHPDSSSDSGSRSPDASSPARAVEQGPVDHGSLKDRRKLGKENSFLRHRQIEALSRIIADILIDHPELSA